MTEKETEQNMLMEFIADTCYIDITKKRINDGVFAVSGGSSNPYYKKNIVKCNSSILFKILTPPALPLPPAWICAFKTNFSVFSDFAFSINSSTVKAKIPSGTTAPYFFKICFAWCS